jgi:sugar lactone lactonase YvrE
VAVWDGGEVRRHDATGRLTERIRVPVSRPTSCAFAGGDLDVLVVTSARAGLDASGLAAQPDAGRLFTVRTGHRGVPCSPYRGSLDLFAGDSR